MKKVMCKLKKGRTMRIGGLKLKVDGKDVDLTKTNAKGKVLEMDLHGGQVIHVPLDFYERNRTALQLMTESLGEERVKCPKCGHEFPFSESGEPGSSPQAPTSEPAPVEEDGQPSDQQKFIADMVTYGVNSHVSGMLFESGFKTVDAVKKATKEELEVVNGIGKKTAKTIVNMVSA